MSNPPTRDGIWLEFSLEVDPETAEAVRPYFDRFGQGGAVLEIPADAAGGRVQVKAYLPPLPDQAQRRRGLEEALWHLGRLSASGGLPEPRVRELREEDWAEAWKKDYKPLRLGRRLMIVPSWLGSSPAPDDVVIRLDPGMAFGTGLHPTTQLCLEALEEELYPFARVLDLGTGSGILAIAAAKLGARSVLALDVDGLAIEVARRNVKANRVGQRVRVEYGSLEELSDRRFDLIVVNIYADTILRFLDQGLLGHLWPGGVLIGSGILAQRVPEVAAEFHRCGLVQVREMTREDWGAVTGRLTRR